MPPPQAIDINAQTGRHAVCIPVRRRSRRSEGSATDDVGADGRQNDDDISNNPRARRRRRIETNHGRCCDCTRAQCCSDHPLTNCECRTAGRECSNCLPHTTGTSSCRNQPSNLVRRPEGESDDADAPEDHPLGTQPPSQELDSEDEEAQPDPPRASGGNGSGGDAAQRRNSGPRAAGSPTDADAASTARDDDDAADGGGEPARNPSANTDLRDLWEQNPDLVTEMRDNVTEAEKRLYDVCSGHIEQNDGRELHGGIDPDLDEQHKGWYDDVMASGYNLYDCPNSAIGKEVIYTWTELLKGVRERKHNSELAMIFLPCILARGDGIVQAADIKRRVEFRLNCWKEGKIAGLVQDLVNQALQRVGAGRPTVDPEKKNRVFNSTVLNGQIRKGVRNLTDRGGGGVLLPDDKCTKTNQPVFEVLEEKHPEMEMPDLANETTACFEEYDKVPAHLPLQVVAEDVEKLSNKLSGSAGPSSQDAAHLTDMLTRHGKASYELREEISAWAEWMGNTFPPFAAYRALLTRRLVALDKQPGVRPVGIGEILYRMIAKLVLTKARPDTKAACGSTQLCAGLEAGLDAALHAIRAGAKADGSLNFEDDGEARDDERDAVQEMEAQARHWPEAGDSTADTEDESGDGLPSSVEELNAFLQIDGDNGFNRLSRIASMWTVRHRCPKLFIFYFNCYRHHTRLLVRRPGQAPYVILSKEGVTQGCPLAMDIYGIGLLPMVERLREAEPDLLQPWYADDGSGYGRLERLRNVYKLLEQIGPDFGYYPAGAKCWLTIPERWEEEVKQYLADNDLPWQTTTGKRYVGGFIGSEDALRAWIEPKVEDWKFGIERLAAAAVRYPQTAYTGLNRSLQCEWQYISRVVEGAEQYLEPLEEAIREEFLPALLGVDKTEIDDDMRNLIAHSVKNGGMAIPNPVEAAPLLYKSSVEASSVLVEALRSGGSLNQTAHRECVRQAGKSAKQARLATEKANLDEMKRRATRRDKKRLERISGTGAFLTLRPSRRDGTELERDEFRDAILLRMGLVPKNLPRMCDGCGATFTVEHALTCKKGGLIVTRHNDCRDEYADLASKATTASRVTTEPMIYYGGNEPVLRQANGARNTSNNNNSSTRGGEERGDLAIHGLVQRQRTTIMDFVIVNTDAPSYGHQPSMKVLEKAAKRKKDKYLEACRERRRDFIPMAYSMDGLAGKEARAAEKRLASLLASKWDRPYSEMACFVKTRMSLSIVRSISMLLRGCRSSTWKRRAPDDGVAARASVTSQRW